MKNTKTSKLLFSSLFCLTLPEILIYEPACTGGRGTLLKFQQPVVKLFPGPEATALKRGRDNPGEILESPIQSSRTKIWAGKSGREKETKTRKQANFFSARYSA